MSVGNPKVKINTKPDLHGKTERAGLNKVHLEQVYTNDGKLAQDAARQELSRSGETNPGKFEGRKPTENPKTLESIRLRAEIHDIARHERESLEPEVDFQADDSHAHEFVTEPEFEEMNKVDRELRAEKEITYKGVNLETLWTPWVASGDRFGKVKESSHTKHHTPLPDSGMRKTVSPTAYRKSNVQTLSPIKYINMGNGKYRIAPVLEFTPANPTVRDNVPQAYWLDMALKSLQF